jgi:hypothetical protein
MGHGRGEQSTRIKCNSVTICSPQILHVDLGTEPVPLRLESASATVQFDIPYRGMTLYPP